jgi:hypothetical protein
VLGKSVDSFDVIAREWNGRPATMFLFEKVAPIRTTRRRFLKTIAGTASIGLADVTTLSGLRAFADEDSVVPANVRFGLDVEPIVRLIEDTPRGDCVRVLIDQLGKGLPYRRLLAGVFFAGIRRSNSYHDVYKIQPVHQMCTHLRPEERLLPLFWAVDGFKTRQETWSNPPLTELSGTLPGSTEAAAELAAALETADLDTVERALIVLARNKGSRLAVEQLWLYCCSNGGAGGHGAIAVASCVRALETIGWEHAEPVLRTILRDVSALGGKGKRDAYCLANEARVDRHVEELPDGWGAGQFDRVATLELFGLLREGKVDQACDLAVSQLLQGVGAKAVWDAVHLATAELMVRHESGWGVASRPLHSNMSTAALRYASLASDSMRVRLLALLQAVAWAGDKTASELQAGSLRDIQIAQMPLAELPATPEEAVADIFSQLPPRNYYWDPHAGMAITTYGSRTDADAACRKVFTLAQERPDATPLFMQAARSWMCQKSTTDPHDYKFLAAILEEAEAGSPQWQPHLLAASVHFIHGKQSPDYPAVQQAREALRPS